MIRSGLESVYHETAIHDDTLAGYIGCRGHA